MRLVWLEAGAVVRLRFLIVELCCRELLLRYYQPNTANGCVAQNDLHYQSMVACFLGEVKVCMWRQYCALRLFAFHDDLFGNDYCKNYLLVTMVILLVT